MQYMAVAETDIGISKDTNQDSVLLKHVKSKVGDIILAVICDGMGGLSKGELASATVIREFSRWFDEELSFEIENLDFNIISAKWKLMIKDLNSKILEFGSMLKQSMGTTFTGILIVEDKYLICHVGDTRVYHIKTSVDQLTEDHTFVAREIKRGTLTIEQAKKDKRRNMLLQCIGASDRVEPDMIQGAIDKGAYMICSDGFRHEISSKEIFESLNPINLINKESMHSNVKYLIEENKRRQEKDNISVILIKAY